jgi:hypothetical protein
VKVNGHPLCVDCNLKLEQATSLRHTQLALLYNQALDRMDSIVGLPVTGRRMHIPTPTTINAGQTTYNNIRVDNSVVGAINTGNIKQLDVMMSVMRSGNNQELADALQKLTQAILDIPHLKPSDKNSALEWLSFLSNQALTQETERQPTIGKVAIAALERILSNIGSIASIWSAVKPLLETLF